MVGVESVALGSVLFVAAMVLLLFAFGDLLWLRSSVADDRRGKPQLWLPPSFLAKKAYTHTTVWSVAVMSLLYLATLAGVALVVVALSIDSRPLLNGAFALMFVTFASTYLVERFKYVLWPDSRNDARHR